MVQGSAFPNPEWFSEEGMEGERADRKKGTREREKGGGGGKEREREKGGKSERTKEPKR
jgi:hypothetical protein